MKTSGKFDVRQMKYLLNQVLKVFRYLSWFDTATLIYPRHLEPRLPMLYSQVPHVVLFPVNCCSIKNVVYFYERLFLFMMKTYESLVFSYERVSLFMK